MKATFEKRNAPNAGPSTACCLEAHGSVDNRGFRQSIDTSPPHANPTSEHRKSPVIPPIPRNSTCTLSSLCSLCLGGQISSREPQKSPAISYISINFHSQFPQRQLVLPQRSSASSGSSAANSTLTPAARKSTFSTQVPDFTLFTLNGTPT